MATTQKQDQDFLNNVVGTSLLEDAIDWIKSNMSIEEVFSDKELIASAANFDPEEIFSRGVLETWAEDNGYTKE